MRATNRTVPRPPKPIPARSDQCPTAATSQGLAPLRSLQGWAHTTGLESQPHRWPQACLCLWSDLAPGMRVSQSVNWVMKRPTPDRPAPRTRLPESLQSTQGMPGQQQTWHSPKSHFARVLSRRHGEGGFCLAKETVVTYPYRLEEHCVSYGPSRLVTTTYIWERMSVFF